VPPRCPLTRPSAMSILHARAPESLRRRVSDAAFPGEASGHRSPGQNDTIPRQIAPRDPHRRGSTSVCRERARSPRQGHLPPCAPARSPRAARSPSTKDSESLGVSRMLARRGAAHPESLRRSGWMAGTPVIAVSESRAGSWLEYVTTANGDGNTSSRRNSREVCSLSSPFTSTPSTSSKRPRRNRKATCTG